MSCTNKTKSLLHVQTFGLEDGEKTGVWAMEHRVRCVMKEILLLKLTVVIYSTLPFSFQTCSLACFPICYLIKAWDIGHTRPLHSFSPPWREVWPKENALLGSQEWVCVCCSNVLLVFLDNLPLNKNCWCWSCKDWISFLRGSNCKISRKLLGNANFCLLWSAQLSIAPACTPHSSGKRSYLQW